MHDIVADYETLIRLLKSQEQAVDTENSQKCRALLPLIAKYRNRIEMHQQRVQSLSDQERSLLNPLLEKLSGQIANCKKGWELRRKKLEEARNELRAAQHLVRSAPNCKRHIRLNWTA